MALALWQHWGLGPVLPPLRLTGTLAQWLTGPVSES